MNIKGIDHHPPPPASAGIDYLSHLPLEIQLLILQNLDHVEFTRFGAMCKAWRSIASGARHNPTSRLQRFPIPWLIHGVSPGHKLPKLSNHKMFYELGIFHDSSCICGSSQGWLIFKKPSTTTRSFLLNPITRQRISLPENPKLDFGPLLAGVILPPHQSYDEMKVVAYFRDDGFYHWRSQDKHWIKIDEYTGINISDMIYDKGNIYPLMSPPTLLVLQPTVFTSWKDKELKVSIWGTADLRSSDLTIGNTAGVSPLCLWLASHDTSVIAWTFFFLLLYRFLLFQVFLDFVLMFETLRVCISSMYFFFL